MVDIGEEVVVQCWMYWGGGGRVVVDVLGRRWSCGVGCTGERRSCVVVDVYGYCNSFGMGVVYDSSVKSVIGCHGCKALWLSCSPLQVSQMCICGQSVIILGKKSERWWVRVGTEMVGKGGDRDGGYGWG